MTLEQLDTLENLIDEALNILKNAQRHQVVSWIRERYPHVLEEHSQELIDEGLTARVRRRRKQRAPLKEDKASRNLCFSFGLPAMQLDSEISIPRDFDNLLYGESDWKEADDATLEEIDAHILLLEAQARANFAKADNWRKVRQAAARYAHGDLTLTLRKLRLRARGEE